MSFPDWYQMLPKDFHSIDESKIGMIEELRIASHSEHETCSFAIMSSPWAVETAMNHSLSATKYMYPNNDERDLWGRVLLWRFQIWRATVESGIDEHALSSLSQKRQLIILIKLEKKRNSIIKLCSSFSSIIRFIICAEEDMGNFTFDPNQQIVMDMLNLILGCPRPTAKEMDWYHSVQERIL